ncbi:hypothetical protein [Bdellovibrio svalbardensis]|uniref:Uncharacterized protein n=1 Tax=Bdellovibrio svalbardensis TaxID=2972972 RepID=A0ABT6DL77_9BACT|nr:hypothetical protein [Bdellovibrio svalbardensis]MDG0817634.1 hypothetical protein [Bdellovibrio svalbardensis]
MGFTRTSKKFALTFLAGLLVLSGITAFAAGEQCASIFAEISSTQELNELMVKRYPQLTSILKDPNAYFEKYRERFNEQKKKTPESPFSFDFSEMGLPLVQDINGYLSAKIETVQKDLTALKEKRDGHNKLVKIVRTPFDKSKQNQLELYLKYLGELKAESAEILAKGSVSYRHLVEFSYFYSRAIGRFDTKSYPLKDRFLLYTDRLLEGYKPLSLSKEYEMYKSREFGVFQLHSKYSGYKAAEKDFESAFANKEELKSLWIPTNASIGNSVLMRLMNTRLHLVGVTDAPIWADGYNRPAGDFWMHDVRHESFKFYEVQRYLEKNDLSAEQFVNMQRKMDDWLVELNRETAKIEDPDLKKAVSLTSFNFHHDAGFPLIPSMYLAQERYQPVRSLYTMHIISGHGVTFKDPWNNLDKAEVWLKDFWRQRIDQEYEALDLAKSSSGAK